MKCIKSVQFCQQLHQRSLDFTITGCRSVQSFCTNGIDLVEENHARSLFFRQRKQFANHATAFADVLLCELTAHHPNEGGVGVVGNGLGQQGLPTAWRTDKEDAFGRHDTDLLEQLGLHEREFDGFTDGFHLLIQTSNILVVDGWFFYHFCPTDHRIPCFVE